MLDLSSRGGDLAGALRVDPRHLRSARLDRDFADPGSSLHYVVTPFLEATIRRLERGLAQGSPSRAWRLTGDYGTGKSSLGLAFARLAAHEDNSLPVGLRSGPGLKLLPALVVGERESIGRSVLRGLRDMAARLPGRRRKRMTTLLEDRPAPEPAEILQAIEAVGNLVRELQAGDGVLLVLDELGKNLEHVVASPGAADDVFLLQHLAELAARSGDKPLMVVAILHQSVASYAAALPTAARREWEKVAGRYEEIVFAPPIEQSVQLVSSALDIDWPRLPAALISEARSRMEAAVELKWYGAAAPREALVSLAPSLLPLDPFVLPVLVRILRMFGQNERSLFGFVSSPEPFGVMEHARMPMDEARLYRLHDLYDYVASNLPSLLAHGPAAARWSVVASVVSAHRSEDLFEVELLKTVGLLNLLDDPALPPTELVLRAAVAGDGPNEIAGVNAALDHLTRGGGVLYRRGAAGGLFLWPNTSVDLAGAFSEASAIVAPEVSLARVAELLPSEPLVARRHYVETGALRHFERRYATGGNLEAAIARTGTRDRADGVLLIVLSEGESDYASNLSVVGRSLADLPASVLVGLPAPVGELGPLLQDLLAWQWVSANAPGMTGDRLARDETSRQLSLAEGRLRRAMSSIVDLHSTDGRPLAWFHNGEPRDLPTSRTLLAYLSSVCDRTFDLSPVVTNELVNRRTLSSAAARARHVLIEALATSPSKIELGIATDGTPPERAMYLSILRQGRVHVPAESGWVVEIPQEEQDPLRLRPALMAIDARLRASDERVPYAELISILTGGRYGVREGLAPLLVAVYLAARWHHTAVYEDGTYLDQVGGPEFNRIVKEPEHFDLQHCAIDGVRAVTFSRLAAAVGVEPSAEGLDLLDVVRPLTQFVARLPDHARRTRRLSAIAVAVREALVTARDPTRLIFRDLPVACGIAPIGLDGEAPEDDVALFIARMKDAVREMRDAYPALITRLVEGLRAALEFSGNTTSAMRPEAARRAGVVLGTVSEPDLKAFLLRLSDVALDDQAWVESLASTLVRKPPERWGDVDEAEFQHRLPQIARRFGRVEAAAFATVGGEDADSSTRAYRLVVTATDGQEVEEVLRLGSGDEAVLESVERQVRELLALHGRLGVLAAARALLTPGDKS